MHHVQLSVTIPYSKLFHTHETTMLALNQNIEKTKIYLNVNMNFLLTERKGRTGEYWPEVVAVRIERTYENDRGPIFPSTARAS